jgi:GT2 family glycosyltransferase
MGTEAPTISVIICVYTLARWTDICNAVQSVREQVLKASEILIVVDYNDELLARAQAHFSDVLVVANRQARGLSGGRNTGISVSSGSLVAFLDDDAVAEPDWLARLAEHCEKPNVFGATAKVVPIWGGSKPRWFPEEFLWTVGCSYRGLPVTAQEVRNGFGGASMFKRQLFERAGLFAISLGRQGTNIPLSCEDTELCIRGKAAFPEGRFILEPASVIWHYVPCSRLTWTYFYRRCYAEGLSKAYLTTLFESAPSLATERVYVMRALSSGLVLGFADFFFRFDSEGLRRSAAIILGLASAGVGFCIGKIQTFVQKTKLSWPLP